MKTTINQQDNRQSKPLNTQQQHRPENKDNLDSRSGEEQDFKGSNQTHNSREKHSDNKKH